MSNYIPAGPVRSLHDGVGPGGGQIRRIGALSGPAMRSYASAMGGIHAPTQQIGSPRRGVIAQIRPLSGPPLRSYATAMSGPALRSYRGAMGAFIGATMQASDYTAIAAPLAASSLLLPFMTDVVVTTDADGKNPIVTPFADQSAASSAYDAAIASPGTRAYIGLFRKNPDGSVMTVDETFLTAFQLKSLFSQAWPWLALGAVIVGGYYLNKKRTGRARARGKR